MKTKLILAVLMLCAGCGVSRREYLEDNHDRKQHENSQAIIISRTADSVFEIKQRLEALEKKLEERKEPCPEPIKFNDIYLTTPPRRFSESAERSAQKTDEKFGISESSPIWTHCLEYGEAFYQLITPTMAVERSTCTLELVGLDDGRVLWRKPDEPKPELPNHYRVWENRTDDPCTDCGDEKTK